MLAVADVALANDSGPRHLAEALGTATVGINWAGNLITAGPHARARHRVAVQRDLPRHRHPQVHRLE